MGTGSLGRIAPWAYFDLFSNDTAEKAAELANQGRMQGYAQLSDIYGQGRGALESNYGKAADVWTNFQNKIDTQGNPYASGAAAYGDVTGAGGVEGLKRATDLWKNSGQYGVYGVGLNEGLSALARAHSAAGNLSSGNADTDAMKYAADQATKSWGTFQSGLQPYLSADLSTRTNALNASGNAAQGLANTYGALGAGLNASDMAQGNAANTTQTGIGANNAGAEMNNYNVGANQLNALLGVGNWISGGGIGKLQSGLQPLFSGFGGK